MYTTFSGVESIPPLTSRRRRPDSFIPYPVVAVLFSPPVVKFLSSPAHEKQPSSRTPMFTSTFSSRLTKNIPVQTFKTHTSTFRPYCSTDFVQYLSQTTAEVLAPPFAQDTPQESLNNSTATFQVSRLSISRCASCKVYDPAKLYFFQLKHQPELC